MDSVDENGEDEECNVETIGPDNLLSGGSQTAGLAVVAPLQRGTKNTVKPSELKIKIKEAEYPNSLVLPIDCDYLIGDTELDSVHVG